MICKNCNASIPDDSAFCLLCGKRVETAPAATPICSTTYQQTRDYDNSKSEGTECAGSDASRSIDNGSEAAKFCPHCGVHLDADAIFCNNCGKKLGAEKAQMKSGGIKAPTAAKKRVIIAASIAAILAIVLIVGFATNWFAATGPATQIASAVKNTLTSKNFTVDFECSFNEHTGRDNATVGAATGRVNETWGTAYVSINPAKREITLYADLTTAGETGVIAIYDGYYIASSSYGCWRYDIRDQIDAYFDAYEEGTAKNFSCRRFIDTVASEGAYDEIKKDIDFDMLDTCLSSYIMNLNDKNWLKENAGYSVKKDGGVTEHCFTPNIYDFLKSSATGFKKAFRDRDLYDQMIDEISDLRYGSRYTDTSVVFGIKSGKLVQFDCKISGSEEGLTYGDELQIEAEFYNFSKTAIDKDELEDLLAEAKRSGY